MLSFRLYYSNWRFMLYLGNYGCIVLTVFLPKHFKPKYSTSTSNFAVSLKPVRKKRPGENMPEIDLCELTHVVRLLRSLFVVSIENHILIISLPDNEHLLRHSHSAPIFRSTGGEIDIPKSPNATTSTLNRWVYCLIMTNGQDNSVTSSSSSSSDESMNS